MGAGLGLALALLLASCMTSVKAQGTMTAYVCSNSTTDSCSAGACNETTSLCEESGVALDPAESCTIENGDNCPAGGFCDAYTDPLTSVETHYCHCHDGFFRNATDEQCYRTVSLVGGSCSTDGHVLCDHHEYLICDDQINLTSPTQTCVCDGEYAHNADTDLCELHVSVGETCDQNERVYCSDVAAECTDSTCQCQAPHYEDGGICVQDVSLGEACDAVNNCNNQNVLNAACENGTCSCAGEFIEENNRCVRYMLNGEDCSADVGLLCADVNAVCSLQNECVCSHPHTLNATTNICVTAAGLGEACNDINLCTTPNSQCSDATDVCVCELGFIRIGDYCVAESDTLDNTLETVCESNSDCVAHAFSECQEMPGVSGNASISYCTCRFNNGWRRQGEPGSYRCLKEVAVNNVCERDLSYCADTNAECHLVADNLGLHRCKCITGYKDIGGTCALIITTLTDPSCEPCIRNEGICYDAILDDGINNRTGCLCKLSALGENCDDILLRVSCQSNPFQMLVCYEPHEGYIFENNGASLYTNGYGDDEACKGLYRETEDVNCNVGEVELILPLVEQDLETCGTSNRMADLSTRKYENMISVESGPSSTLPTLHFDVYCTYLTQTDIGSNGVGVQGIPGNDRGEHRDPTLQLRVNDNLDREVPPDVALRLGDKVSLELLLADDGTYSSMRVAYMMASNRPRADDPDADAIQIIMEGCPMPLTEGAVDTRIITDTNNFYRVNGAENNLKTGDFRMFGLRSGHTVFLHIRVKLCLTGSEAQCAPVPCGSGYWGNGRRKRDINSDAGLTDVTRELIWYQEEEEAGMMQIEASTFTAVITLLVLLLLVFIVITGLLLWRFCRSKSMIDDMPPQRFAMPRLVTPGNNPHLRL